MRLPPERPRLADLWGELWREDAWRELWRGRDVAIVYAFLVVVISTVAAVRPPGLLRDIVGGSSTNLVNLRERPLSVLFASAFVVSHVWGLWIIGPMVAAYGVIQRWLGRASLIAVAVLGHVGATLFVATMEITELAKGRVSLSVAVRPDVGVSFGLAAVAGVLVARVAEPWRQRYLLASALVVIGQFFLLRGFTALGHVTAWLIGLAVAVPLSRLQRVSPPV